jgi:hypothetical protein
VLLHGVSYVCRYEEMLHKTDEMLIKLHSHPLTEKLPRKLDMLVSASFMRGVAADDVERLMNYSNSCVEVDHCTPHGSKQS